MRILSVCPPSRLPGKQTSRRLKSMPLMEGTIMQDKDRSVRRTRKMRRFLRMCGSFVMLIVCPSGAVRAQGQKPLLLRDPSISNAEIAFSYAGNIWVAGRDGKNVRRLTSGGHEGKPVFSPDGSQIAFVGDYDGNRGMYVVPAAGGEPRRLTYHPADGHVVGWTPDGKRILFTSSRAA